MWYFNANVNVQRLATPKANTIKFQMKKTTNKMRQDALKGKMSTEHHLKMNIYLITIEAEYTDSTWSLLAQR